MAINDRERTEEEENWHPRRQNGGGGFPLFLVSSHPIYRIALLERAPSRRRDDFISDLPEAKTSAVTKYPVRVCPFLLD